MSIHFQLFEFLLFPNIGLDKPMTICVFKFLSFEVNIIYFIYSLTEEITVYNTDKLEKIMFRPIGEIGKLEILRMFGSYETGLELKVFYTRVHC